MTAAGEAGDLVRLHRGKQVRVRGVYGALLERSGAQVTVQTFAVVIGLVEPNRTVRLAEILHVNVVQTVKFCPESSEHRIVGVTGIAGMVRRDPVILKVRGSQIVGIV